MWILAIYYIACLIYVGVYAFYYKDSRSMYKPFIAMCLPVAGLLVAAAIEVMKHGTPVNIFESENEAIENDVGRRWIVAQKVEDTVFMNINDALMLSDINTRRKLILNIIKHEPEMHMPGLKAALENEDGEVSHYASSAVTHILSKLLVELQGYISQYDENKDNEEFLLGYTNTLKTYISSGFAEQKIVMTYIHYYRDVLLQLIGIKVASETHFAELVDIYLSEKDHTNALKYAQHFLDTYPESDVAYMKYANVCVESKNNELLVEIIEKLFNSSIMLSPKNMASFRFWLQAIKGKVA